MPIQKEVEEKKFSLLGNFENTGERNKISNDIWNFFKNKNSEFYVEGTIEKNKDNYNNFEELTCTIKLSDPDNKTYIQNINNFLYKADFEECTKIDLVIIEKSLLKSFQKATQKFNKLEVKSSAKIISKNLQLSYNLPKNQEDDIYNFKTIFVCKYGNKYVLKLSYSPDYKSNLSNIIGEYKIGPNGKGKDGEFNTKLLKYLNSNMKKIWNKKISSNFNWDFQELSSPYNESFYFVNYQVF